MDRVDIDIMFSDFYQNTPVLSYMPNHTHKTVALGIRDDAAADIKDSVMLPSIELDNMIRAEANNDE